MLAAAEKVYRVVEDCDVEMEDEFETMSPQAVAVAAASEERVVKR